VIREINGAKEAGLNRAVWDLRHASPIEITPGQQGGGGGGGGGGFFGGGRGPRAAPGEYTIRLTAAGKQSTKTVRVEEDARVQISEADRARWSDATMKVYELQKSADRARRAVLSLKTQMTALQDALKKNPSTSQAINSAVKTVSDQIDDLQRKLVPVSDGPLGGAGPALPGTPRPLVGRVGQLAGGLDGYTAAPTSAQLERIDELSGELKAVIELLNRVVEEAVPNLNKQMRDSGAPFVNPGQRITLPQ
jgi:hypothetical protein